MEICVDSMAGLQAAMAGGADRIELCADLTSDGLTPSLDTVRQARRASHVPIVVLVRPRPGDFCYSDQEADQIGSVIESLRSEEVEGVVTGALLPGGQLDRERMLHWMDVAKEMPVTCHRCFDHVAAPEAALEELIQMGVQRVLTSGQAATAIDGIPNLRRLQHQASGRIEILAGGGVRSHNVLELLQRTGVQMVHSSAAIQDGARTSEEEVRALVAAVRG